MLLFLLFAATASAEPDTEQGRFEACTALAKNDPAKALDQAGDWRLHGGGILARHCEGLAYAAQQRWVPAATAFEAAARDADTHADGRSGNLWVQAGNAALAGKEAARAKTDFDAAIVRGEAAGADLGELHLDRARARVALGDLTGARGDLDVALKLVSADPLAWLLSATLARRTNDFERAINDITEAAKRSPDDAQVALEAGNIAVLSGHDDAARTAWTAAIKNAPQSAAAKAAMAALARLDASR